MKKRIAFLVTLLALTVFSSALAGPTKTATAAENPLVITAVQITGGEGKTSEDFIEFYNPNPDPFNLNGYRLVKRSSAGTTDSSIKSWSTDTFIPAYSFYLWANSTFTTISSVPDTTTSSTLADNNGVALRFGALDTGTLVDSLSWGTTTNGFNSSGLDNPLAGQSIKRNSLFESIGYSFGISSPRNSLVQVLPDVVLPPTPIDNATCSINDSSLALQQGSSNPEVTLQFTNSGNTTWSNSGYLIDASNSNDIALTAGQSISAGNVLNVNQMLVLPTNVGHYVYEWQMAHSGLKFGQKCNLDLEITAEPEVPEEDPDPEEFPKTIRINELLVNPHGKDDGQEVVELYNYGTQTVDLENWVLDDITDNGVLTSDALTLGNVELQAGKYMTITIPANKFVMNNTKGDVVSLLDEEGEFIDTVIYTANSPTGKTYSLLDNTWKWSKASLGQKNPMPVVDPEQEEEENELVNVVVSGLEISEIYASPSEGEQEFLELYNGGSNPIDLSNVKLQVGNRTSVLESIELLPGEFTVLEGGQLPLRLVDNGAVIKLMQIDGKVIFEVTYPKAKRGESFSSINHKFLWSLSVTPNEQNIFTEKLSEDAKVNNSSSVKSAAKKNVSTTSSSLSKNSSTKKTTVTPSVTKANSSIIKPDNGNIINEEQQNLESDSGQKSGNKAINIAAMAAASVGAGAFALYRFGV